MSTCILITGSITQAVKAKKLLLAHSITADVTKLASDMQGCRYGVRLPCIQKDNAQRILHAEGIHCEDYTQ